MKMYEWTVILILKNGKEITAYYHGKETNSVEVANKIFSGIKDEIIGLSNKDGTENIFVLRNELVAIRVLKE